MRAAAFALAFLLAFSVPLFAAPEADAQAGFCPVMTERVWVCFMRWDEPNMVCVEYLIIGRHAEHCREIRTLP